ncbi:Retinaldehyde-binding protein 1 [Orchesella cincta]|uniref:Retinaldehyde-binding protein 1 n=1 Tax=Orchesella cincta TaxID=48709 RepID=A0A1D2M4F5_ORCCI|nr:Retinaldehyde-binding protein 1 [Orchesella cincta]
MQERDGIAEIRSLLNAFPTEPIDVIGQLKKYGVVGMLKARDKLGRRILFLNAEKWDPDEISSEQMTIMGLYLLERGLRDDDMMTNGIVFIHSCSGMGLKHAKLYTLHKTLRIINICWYSYPLKVKGIYYVNVPIYLVYLYKLVKPFLTSKFKERLKLSTKDNTFETLHENLSPDLLPKCVGGILEDEEAFDWEFLETKL